MCATFSWFIHQWHLGERSSDPTKDWPRHARECPGVSGRGVGWQWPAAGLEALSVAVCACDLLKEVAIISITSTIVWKWKVKSFSHVQPFAPSWTVAYQDPPSMGIFQARFLEWIAISFSRGSSQPRDQTRVSLIVDRHFTVWATREGATLFWIRCLQHFL